MVVGGEKLFWLSCRIREQAHSYNWTVCFQFEVKWL